MALFGKVAIHSKLLLYCSFKFYLFLNDEGMNILNIIYHGRLDYFKNRIMSKNISFKQKYKFKYFCIYQG